MEEQSAVGAKAEKVQPVNTVLVVDDEENWCFVIKRILQKAGVGNQIFTANNGLQALEKLKAIAATNEKLPELIFIDLKMPVMDGFEFLEEATQSPELDLSQTRIFVLTSSMLPQDKERANEYPIAGFISKPLTHQILTSIIS
ncbi:response regulator [Adhaeribacter rhizoryzae]|uniref:Response regulator n=1 Tax=Adhaeribacter rhizoryzae TaxID=2607907 RepID=A0A5M6DGW1_9BACT|nr:response regulator [Adhaeribacter rhizoryzae]KAA5546778.1 response regulator [Adhaeribacter rhizoryzae]